MLMSGVKRASTIVTDDYGQEHDHDRFQHRGEGGHSVVDLAIEHSRDLYKHFGKFAGLFAHIDHADHHWRKHFAGFERLHDRFAFFDAVVHPRECASDGGIARSLTR